MMSGTRRYITLSIKGLDTLSCGRLNSLPQEGTVRLRTGNILPLTVLLSATLLFSPGCGKIKTPDSGDAYICFLAPEVETKAVKNTDMSGGYSKSEKFKVWALFHAQENSLEGESYMDGVTCTYQESLDAWVPDNRSDGKPYLWPAAGYLTFQAWSPAETGVLI